MTHIRSRIYHLILNAAAAIALEAPYVNKMHRNQERRNALQSMGDAPIESATMRSPQDPPAPRGRPDR